MNPLLQIQFRVPFDQIRAEHVEPAVQQLLEEARANQAALSSSTGPRTFDTTLLALESLTEKLDWAMGVVRHLESVATYPELRAAYNAVQPEVSLFYTNIVLDAGIWRMLKEYADTDEARALTGVRARFLKKTMDGFRRSGADLDEPGKKRLQEIEVELAQATTKFSENVLDSTNAFELIVTDEKQLSGLPPSAIDAARESANQKGVEGWRFTLQAPSYTAVLTYMDDRATRETMYRAFTTRATEGIHDNSAVLARILDLRRLKAGLLGYRDFADLVLEERMAKNAERALAFVHELHTKTKDRFEQENAELHAFRREIEGPNAPEMQPWDVGYYSEKQRQALYDFDEEELRPYFELDTVVAGMYELVDRLYGIQVREEKGVPGWDAAVKTYAIVDADGTTLGSFYADWFPRENKRGGAWMDALLTGGPRQDSFHPHLGLICGNLTPPVADRPSLLTHREVETVFHEFGHLLHHCLSRVEIRSLAGTNVAWDFVELPSQIMENWCWERESLDLFAKHYQSGETLPQDLFDKMVRAKNFRAANMQMRQLSFATTDLALHTQYSPDRDGDVIGYSRTLMQRFSAAPLPSNYAMIASFTHLFSSPVAYAAGYYSYKWAEVLDADAFTQFRKLGVFSREAGMQFRDRILARGDSEDPAELYRSFMGRDPDINALLRRSGLAA
ncbi:MAG TPA: M3 family metallopeptidase [Bryobacteraceae bacterium]|nr:M3 family metallopeptidase [Bryobacteraceae bacterium]